MKKATSTKSKTQSVDEFMDKLNHPFKAEVQAVRDIIKGVSQDITEAIKWNAPSFSYKGYLVTFNLSAKHHVHLVFHAPEVVNIKNKLLEGNYPARRMVYFSDMKDVKAKKTALAKVVKALVKLIDESK